MAVVWLAVTLAANAALVNQGCQGLDKTGLSSSIRRNAHPPEPDTSPQDRIRSADFRPIFPGELEMGMAPITSAPNENLFQQCLAVGVGEYPLLGKATICSSTLFHLLPHLPASPSGDQVGVGNIHVVGRTGCRWQSAISVSGWRAVSHPHGSATPCARPSCSIPRTGLPEVPAQFTGRLGGNQDGCEGSIKGAMARPSSHQAHGLRAEGCWLMGSMVRITPS